MLILNLLFCCSKEAAEGNQMTMIVGKSEEDKCSVQTCLNKLSVMPQIERKELSPFGRQQFTNSFYAKERRNTVVEQWLCYISDRMFYVLLHCMHQTVIVNSYFTDYRFHI